MEQKSKKHNLRLKPRHILFTCMVCLVFVFMLMRSQEGKLLEIAAEQQRLQEKYEQLLLEEQLLERMIEFASTDDYIEQIARERLGYVWPDDYKFFR